MAAYLIRRLWQMIPTLFGVVLLVFLLFKGFGGDPAEILGGLNATQAQVDAIRQQLGLNEPLWTQFWIFVKQIVTFDWGKSWATNEAVGHLFATRLPATLTVMVPILILDTLLAIPFAMGVAYVRGSLTDRSIMMLTTVALSISFLVYVIVGQYVFAFQLGLFPVQGWSDSLWTNLRVYSPLPVLLAVAVSLAPTTRLYRSFFLDEIGHDYVRTARAKGLTEQTILLKHVLRNAMIPILTNVAVALPGIFVGSFLIEVFFSIPGPRARTVAVGEPQRLPGDPGLRDLHGGDHDVREPADRRALQAGRPTGGAEMSGTLRQPATHGQPEPRARRVVGRGHAFSHRPRRHGLARGRRAVPAARDRRRPRPGGERLAERGRRARRAAHLHGPGAQRPKARPSPRPPARTSTSRRSTRSRRATRNGTKRRRSTRPPKP